MSGLLFQQHRMLAQPVQVKVCAHRRQAAKKYAAICRSSGHAGDTQGLSDADAAMRAGLVLVHEAILFKGATAESGAKAACQKAMLMISKRDLSSDMQPRLYEVGRSKSVG